MPEINVPRLEFTSMEEQPRLITLKGITKAYDGVTVLDHINLYIRKKEFVTLLGPSGCGKTTTLRIIGGFENPDEGVISPKFANSNVDLPALPAEAYRLVEDQSSYGVMDIGGDDRGAYALGRYVPFMQKENNYRMIFVANCYRALTRNAQDALEVMREIEAACGLQFTDIVNNSHLGNFTDTQTLLDSQDFIKELSELSGLPVYMTTVRADLADAVGQHIPNVFPLHLQEKYFDLPDQKI